MPMSPVNGTYSNTYLDPTFGLTAADFDRLARSFGLMGGQTTLAQTTDLVENAADVIADMPEQAKEFTKAKSAEIRRTLERSDVEFKLTRKLTDLRHEHDLARKAEAKERAALEAKHAAQAKARQDSIAAVRRDLKRIDRAKQVAGIR